MSQSICDEIRQKGEHEHFNKGYEHLTNKGFSSQTTVQCYSLVQFKMVSTPLRKPIIMCSTLAPQFISNAHLLKNKRLLIVHWVEAIVGDSFGAKLLSHCVCGKAVHVHLNVSPDALV